MNISADGGNCEEVLVDFAKVGIDIDALGATSGRRRESFAIAATKQVICDAFKADLKVGEPAEKAGILVDEQFGAAVLRDAARHGYMTACRVEKSGQDQFDFEYGEDSPQHIEKFHPMFCKVLVRFNPEGDPVLNVKPEVWKN